MDYKEINKQTYTSVTHHWDTKRTRFWEPIVKFLEKIKNRENKKILDLGCGAGINLQLATNLKFKEVLGIDISKGQVKRCQGKGFNAKIGELEKIPLEDYSQDIIICIATLHHLLEKDKQLKALQEIKRVLKEDGKLLLSNWFPDEKYIQKELEKGKFKFLDNKKQKVKVTYTSDEGKFDRYYYLFKENEIKELCKDAGFKIINSYYHKENNKFKGNYFLELE